MNNNTIWTVPALDRLQQLRAEGVAYAQIAELFEMTPGAIETACRRHGIISGQKVGTQGGYRQPDILEEASTKEAVEKHAADIIRVHGEDKRWPSIALPARRGLPLRFEQSSRFSSVGSPAAQCALNGTPK